MGKASDRRGKDKQKLKRSDDDNSISSNKRIKPDEEHTISNKSFSTSRKLSGTRSQSGNPSTNKDADRIPSRRLKVYQLPNILELLNKVARNNDFYKRALVLKLKNQDSELVELDERLRSTSLLSSSNVKTETDNESEIFKRRLEDVLKWKMSRGKFRPTLPSLLAKNSKDEIGKTVSEVLVRLKGFDRDSHIENSDEMFSTGVIDEMCKLKGIGPATASAFLSFEVPNIVPFFSDEASSYFEESLGPIKYTAKFYKKFVDCMISETERLNAHEADDKKEYRDDSKGRSDAKNPSGKDSLDAQSKGLKIIGKGWNFGRLERCIWTITTLKEKLNDEDWTEFCNS
ncbi:expressed protein [Phakopsora pachyrhizi]|uniref:Expressed protein n=1 Tax=Phakopsora pachyrhizi TaxID=170000 RepID=A0AAV0AHS0_PHAPC|nr:expressed protein [Phakopsora pachyrhizi]